MEFRKYEVTKEKRKEQIIEGKKKSEATKNDTLLWFRENDSAFCRPTIQSLLNFKNRWRY